jgi:hypothetical protein
VAFNNRAAAYLRKGDSQNAILDLDEAIKINSRKFLAGPGAVVNIVSVGG